MTHRASKLITGIAILAATACAPADDPAPADGPTAADTAPPTDGEPPTADTSPPLPRDSVRQGPILEIPSIADTAGT